jgi:cysteinyl-tRNA synthetase
VLFDVSTMADYGKLSNRRLEDQQAGARVEVSGHKRNPGDFVLWKESGKDQPGWPARFGWRGETVEIVGRPGWHIECSVMSRHHLGEVFDIHGGGLDLIFPHHENEIAQSRCAHGTETMARYWLHNGFLQVEGRKMAKSEGNFVTIHDILKTPMPALIGVEHSESHDEIRRRWNGLSARFSMLQTHYREPIDWTERRLLQSSDELYGWYELLHGINFDATLQTDADQPVVDALLDDINTWEAITRLRDAAKNGRTRELGEGLKLLGLLHPYFVEGADIILFDRAAGVDKQAVEGRVDHRLSLLREKNFAEADRIREELSGQGIQLMDYKDPETGERRTKWEVKR